MTDHEFDDLQRAATALREGLREQAEAVRFAPLQVEELVTAPERRSGRARWIGIGVAVAAAASATALLVPSLLGTGPVPATPAPVGTPSATPSEPVPPAEPGWRTTALPPLSPRRDAVKVWLGDSYLIAGGFDAAPCLSEEDQGDPEKCPETQALRDGARYDPVTDSWRPIAEAPRGVWWMGAYNGYPVAVIGSIAYVANFEEILAYDGEADSWESVPSPKVLGMLWAAGGLLVNVPDDGGALRYDTYDPASRSWTSHVPEVGQPSEGRAVTGSAVIGDDLAFMAAHSNMREEDTLWVSLVDVRSGEVTGLGWTPVPNQRPAASAVGGLLSWPRGGFHADAPDTQAWFLDPGTQAWTSVDLPNEAHGLTWSIGPYRRDWYITTDTAITLRGRLYDPAAQAWIEVPGLPLPDQDPVVVGGADSVLACFGYDPGTAAYGRDCALLRPT